jgi:hypothetical protein
MIHRLSLAYCSNPASHSKQTETIAGPVGAPPLKENPSTFIQRDRLTYGYAEAVLLKNTSVVERKNEKGYRFHPGKTDLVIMGNRKINSAALAFTPS